MSGTFDFLTDNFSLGQGAGRMRACVCERVYLTIELDECDADVLDLHTDGAVLGYL